jgi:hypothetical protein
LGVKRRDRPNQRLRAIGTNLVDAGQNLEPPMNTDKHIRERSKSSHSAPATSNHPTPVTAT